MVREVAGLGAAVGRAGNVRGRVNLGKTCCALPGVADNNHLPRIWHGGIRQGSMVQWHVTARRSAWWVLQPLVWHGLPKRLHFMSD